MIFVSNKEKKAMDNTSIDTHDNFLYGNIGKRVENIPPFLEKNNPQISSINLGIFTLKNKNKNGAKKIMWGVKDSEEFLKEISSAFSSDAEIREARAFTIAALLQFALIDYETAGKLMMDEDDLTYVNSAYNTIAGGYILYTFIELLTFDKVCVIWCSTEISR